MKKRRNLARSCSHGLTNATASLPLPPILTVAAVILLYPCTKHRCCSSIHDGDPQNAVLCLQSHPVLQPRRRRLSPSLDRDSLSDGRDE
ncbi:hypothetical protein M0R45_015274 [Rubus argutus]|uniref:Secreted protein n=1 Tax=Rubus argutus TaxID=59490 RepID=A0AAW1XPM6_RUBAR